MRAGMKALALVCAVCLPMGVLTACGEDNTNKQQAAQAGQAVEVSVVTLRSENVPLTVELPGRISAFQSAEIRPQVNGIIQERLFEEGSMVKAGQQLYQIDPSTYRAAFNTASAQLKRAQASLKAVKAQADRYKGLVDINAVSKQEYDDIVARLGEAEADVAIARAARDTAQINLDYTKVLSPISGRIGKSSVTAGALVTANQTTPIALVQQLDPLYVDVTQSSAELMQLRQRIEAGQVMGEEGETPVELVIDQVGQNYKHAGTLKFSDATVDEATGNVQIRAVFPNPEGELLPGLFVRALIKQGELQNVLLVPQQAVTRSPAGAAVAWVVDAENKAQQVPIETAQTVKDKWVVTNGLKDGDRVIVQGAIKVQAGVPVTPIEFGSDKAEPTEATNPEEAPAADAGLEAAPQVEETVTEEPVAETVVEEAVPAVETAPVTPAAPVVEEPTSEAPAEAASDADVSVVQEPVAGTEAPLLEESQIFVVEDSAPAAEKTAE